MCLHGYFILFHLLSNYHYHINLTTNLTYTRWFKYDRDKFLLVYTQIVPVIFEPPCSYFVVLCYFYCFVCTSVGLLPPGESPIAVTNNNINIYIYTYIYTRISSITYKAIFFVSAFSAQHAHSKALRLMSFLWFALPGTEDASRLIRVNLHFRRVGQS